MVDRIRRVVIEAETRGVPLARRELDSLGRSADRVEGNIDGVGASSRRLGGGFRAVAGGALAAYGALQVLRGIGSGVGFLREAVDDTTNINNQLRQATINALELAEARREIEAISLRTRSDFVDNVNAFTRVSIALPDEDLDTRLTFLENFNRLGALGGATSEELGRSLTQLGQSFAGGIVRAEEFNSIVENTPAVVRQVASSLGIGVGALRQRVIDGQLTAEDVLGGLSSENTTAYVNQQFATVAPTVEGATDTLVDQLADTFGEFIEGTGLGTSFANLALDIAGSLNIIGDSAIENGQTVGNFFRGLLSNFGNQGLGGLFSDIFGGTVGQLDYGAIDFTGASSRSLAQQTLDAIEINTKNTADSIGQAVAGEQTPAQNPGFFIGDGRRTQADARIDDAVDSFVNNLFNDVIDTFASLNTQGLIDPFGGGRATNAPDFNRSGVPEQFFGFVDDAGVGLDGLTEEARNAQAALRFLANEGFGFDGPSLIREELVRSSFRGGAAETDARIQEQNAINFINFVVSQDRARVPNVNFGVDRNDDGSFITPQQQANELRQLSPAAYADFVQQVGLRVAAATPTIAGVAPDTPETAAERALRLASEREEARLNRLADALTATPWSEYIDGATDLETLYATGRLTAEQLAEAERDLAEIRDDAIEAAQESRDPFNALNDEINLFAGYVNVTGTALQNLASISDQTAESVASGLGSLGQIIGQFSPVAGAFVGALGGIIATLDAIVGSTEDQAFRSIAGTDGIGAADVRQRRSGLSGFFNGRNTQRDVTREERIAIETALRPNIEIVQEIGEIFDQTFTAVASEGKTAAENAQNFLDITAMQVGGIDALRESGESLGDTLIRVATNAENLSNAFLDVGLNLDPNSVLGQLATINGGLDIDAVRGLRTDEENDAIDAENFTRVLQGVVDGVGRRVLTDDDIERFRTDGGALDDEITRATADLDDATRDIENVLASNNPAATASEIAIDRQTLLTASPEYIELQRLLEAARLFDRNDDDDAPFTESRLERLANRRIDASLFATQSQADLAQSLANSRDDERTQRIVDAVRIVGLEIRRGNDNNRDADDYRTIRDGINMPQFA